MSKPNDKSLPQQHKFLTLKLEEKLARTERQPPRCLVLDPQGGILGQLPITYGSYTMSEFQGFNKITIELIAGDVSLQTHKA